MDLDMTRLLRAAREAGGVLELNASPDRLDPSAIHCRMAHEEGVRIAIDSDAHSNGHIANLRYGIDQGRRGWLRREDVVNHSAAGGNAFFAWVLNAGSAVSCRPAPGANG